MAKYTQNRLIGDIHKGKVSKYNLPAYLYEYTYESLVQEVYKIFGKTTEAQQAINRAYLVTQLKTNLAYFSGAKTYTEVNDITKFLFDKDGNKLPFKDFRKVAGAIDDKYNKQWLRTEQNTAFGQSQSADSWKQYEDQKDIFPLLKYQTALDERVRQSHRAWDNLIFPVNHPFWDDHMPLNGYNCRCRVIQLRDGKESDYSKVEKNEDKVFANNVGKTGQIFTKRHPYYKIKKQDEILSHNNYGFGLPDESNIPKQLRSGGAYAGDNIKFNNDFFKLIGSDEQIKLTISKTGKGSYYAPWKREVVIVDGERNRLSAWHKESVIYHEFGHAIDHQNGLDVTITDYINDLREAYNKRVEINIIREKFEVKDGRGIWTKYKDKVKVARMKALDLRIKEVYKKIFYIDNKYFEKRGLNKMDILEQFSGLRDTIMAINPNYGYGHKKSYFKTGTMRQKEFLAHAFENTFIGNPIFKKYMPELYDQMIQIIKKIKPKQ